MGNAINVPLNEKKALITAMTFHEKGKVALKRQDYAKALVYFLEADQEFRYCLGHKRKPGSSFFFNVTNYNHFFQPLQFPASKLGRQLRFARSRHRLVLSVPQKHVSRTWRLPAIEKMRGALSRQLWNKPRTINGIKRQHRYNKTIFRGNMSN